MKTLIATIALLATVNSYAMRCGTQLITEGDSISKAIKYCGQPTVRVQNFFYFQRDGGFEYRLSIGPKGLIRNIYVKRP